MKYSALEARVFAAATGALVAAPVDDEQVRRFLAALAARAPWSVAWGLRALLWAVWLSPLLFAVRLQSFLQAGRPLQLALWERALDHRVHLVRQLALVVKAMACLCHFDLDAPAGKR